MAESLNNVIFDVISQEIEHKNKFMEDLERAVLGVNETPDEIPGEKKLLDLPP